MKPIIKVPTLSELTYQSIKEQILSGNIRPGEKINVEFKESRTNLNKDVFESVCAF